MEQFIYNEQCETALLGHRLIPQRYRIEGRAQRDIQFYIFRKYFEEG